MKTVIATTLAVLALAIGGLARADTRETQQQNLDKYTPYLGAPVEEFPFWSLYKWQLVGPLKVVVWSTIKDAYLVTVRSPCSRLEWARGISVTSKQTHVVSARFDEVRVDGDRCQIEQIQPIDIERMNHEREAARR